MLDEPIMLMQNNKKEITDPTVLDRIQDSAEGEFLENNKKTNNEIKNRNSRALIEDIQDIAFNLQSMSDHLLDIQGEDKIDALYHVVQFNMLRQSTLAVYAKDVDYRYHCAYKHGLMVKGILKETIQIAQRQGALEWATDLMNIQEAFDSSFSWVMYKYLKIPMEDMVAGEECMKCLNDILLDRQLNGNHSKS